MNQYIIMSQPSVCVHNVVALPFPGSVLFFFFFPFLFISPEKGFRLDDVFSRASLSWKQHVFGLQLHVQPWVGVSLK